MRIVVITPIVAILAGCAQTPAQTAAAAQASAAAQGALAKELAGLAPGKPMTCINEFRSQQVTSYGATIVYRISGNLKYRTDTAGGCERIGRDVLVTKSVTGRTCQGDIAQTFDPVSRIPNGSCTFAAFVPYRKPS